jgi:hypothetical protein
MMTLPELATAYNTNIEKVRGRETRAQWRRSFVRRGLPIDAADCTASVAAAIVVV